MFWSKKKNFLNQLNVIANLDPKLRFCLYLDLASQYETQMTPESAKVLAIQVVNYLMGDDFAKVYDSLQPDVQSKVDAIKNLIEPKAVEAITQNKRIRELMIRLIMTTYLIYGVLFDKQWLDRSEMKNREELIRKYGSDGKEFSDVENFEKYMICTSDYIQNTQNIKLKN